MKYEKKFLQEEQQNVSETQAQNHQAIHEFASPEEMLRFDAKQTRVPDRVAQRLSQSLKNESFARPWWKRMFS